MDNCFWRQGEIAGDDRCRIIKRFLVQFLPAAAISIAVSVSLYLDERESDLRMLRNNEEIKIAAARTAFQKELEKVGYDLHFLASSPELKRLIRTGEGQASIEVEHFIRSKRRYDCIEIYDKSGRSLLHSGEERIPSGAAFLVPTTLAWQRLSMSKISLSKMNGEVQWPRNPVATVSIPVVDGRDEVMGYLAARYVASPFLDGLAAWNENGVGRYFIADNEGYWIKGPTADDEFGFERGGARESCVTSFFPSEWQIISATKKGSIVTGSGMFTYTTIYPNEVLNETGIPHEGNDAGGSVPAYKLICRVPPHIVSASSMSLAQGILVFESVLLAVLAVAAAYGAQMSLRKETVALKLQQAHAELEQIFNTAADGLVVTDSMHRILRISDRLLTIAKLSKDDVIGRPCHEILPGNACGTEGCSVRSVLSGKERVESEESKTFADGSKAWYAVTATPFKGQDGEVLAVVMSFKNITALKEAHEIIIRSRDFYLTLFENFPSLIWRAGLDAKCDYFNRSWLQFTGRNLEQELGDGWTEGVHPDDLNRCVDIYLSSFAKREPFSMEYRLRYHDGSYRWLLDNGRPFSDLKGNFAGYIGSCYDIDERKEMERKLIEEKDFSANLVNGSGIPAFVVDTSHTILMWNPAWEKVTGIKAVDAIGKTTYSLSIAEKYEETLADIVLEKDWARLGELYRITRWCNESSSVQAEKWFTIAADGKLGYFLATASPIVNPEGKLIAVIETMQDITERKILEDELWYAKEAADVASRAKSDFLANMSHELRTPMNGIIGMADLAMGTELTEEQQEYLRLVRQSADSLLTILNDILDFSKIEARRFDLDHIEFSISEVIGNSLKTLALQAKRKGVDLRWRIEQEIPATVLGDPGRLIQVVVNLVSNAIKFTNAGEIIVTADAEMEESAGKIDVHFAVSDTGIGIPKNKIHVIFDSFTQADTSTTRKYGGTGLGLAISKRIVEMMGGRIWVESVEGKGSVFHFVISCELPKQKGQLENLDATDSVAMTTSFSGGAITSESNTGPALLRVLVAEDNVVNQKLVTMFLERRGHSFRIAATGIEVLQALKEDVFDVVLMDVQMPEIDGIKATKAIRLGEAGERAKQIHIIAMTAHSLQEDQERCLQAGMNDFISKPMNMTQLMNMLEGVHLK